MPDRKKNKRGRPAPPEKKLRGYLIWLLIGPAVFFILYLVYAGGGGDKTPPRLDPPRNYLQAGQSVAAGDKTLLAAPGGTIYFSGDLNLGNNRVLAEGGMVFAVIPLVIPETSRDPEASGWFLVDGEGKRYNLLKVTGTNPVESAEKTPPAGPESRLVYLVFKVSKDSGDTFLVYTSGTDQWAWKMPKAN